VDEHCLEPAISAACMVRSKASLSSAALNRVLAQLNPQPIGCLGSRDFTPCGPCSSNTELFDYCGCNTNVIKRPHATVGWIRSSSCWQSRTLMFSAIGIKYHPFI